MKPRNKTAIWWYVISISFKALMIILAVAGLIGLGFLLGYTAYVLGS